MLLQAPFKITARLLPGLQLGTGWLHLETTFPATGHNAGRMAARFILDLPDGIEYVDSTLSSGMGGFCSVVEIFESYLGFLLAAVESYEWQQRNPGRIGENTTLFPLHVVEWATENKSEIECTQWDLTDGQGRVVESLIS